MDHDQIQDTGSSIQSQIRSSARVKAAKESKSKRISRHLPSAATSQAIVISEPQSSAKGKKRAIESDIEEEEEEEEEHPESPPTKKSRASTSTSTTTHYSLRPRSKPVDPKGKSPMPKKPRATTKNKSPNSKNKSTASGPSTQQNMSDQDIEMVDQGSGEEEDVVEDVSDSPHLEADVRPATDPIPSDPLPSNSESGPISANEPAVANSPPVPEPPPTSAVLDEGTASALFGAEFRAMGSYMATLSSRLKTILENIKAKADPTTRLIALQELTELLSMSTEDTLSGYFQIDAFVRELVRIMGGSTRTDDDDESGGDDDEEPQAQDEDAALAAALAMSTGGSLLGEDNVEEQVLACRCLANLIEALPGCAHTVVYHGAVPVLCSKLVNIQYIDLAEQTLSTLEKISEEYPSAIVREGGLSALLNYLDFFATNVQRTALQAASNCCRNASTEHFDQIKQVLPVIRGVLSYSDQRLVEYACLCIIRTVESFYRSSPDLLEVILDEGTIRAVNALLTPTTGSTVISPSTFTNLLRVLSVSARASPKVSLRLLEAGAVATLYMILAGVLPSDEESGGRLADMTVMHNLAHRPNDQVEEALSLISELMPSLPKDGVFDHRAYSERALTKMIKAKNKADRIATRGSAATTGTVTKVKPPRTTQATTETNKNEEQVVTSNLDDGATEASASAPENATPTTSSADPSPLSRNDLLRSNPEPLYRFMRTIVPVLVDVYSASVATQVRNRTLTAILKSVSFSEPDDLHKVLGNVQIASFIVSILSSNDNHPLVVGALQLVELLLMKLPQQYRASFRREGVLHEIEVRANQDLSTKSTQPVSAITSASQSNANSSSNADNGQHSIPQPTLSDGPSGEAETNPSLPPVPIHTGKRTSSTPLDPVDAIILRSRVIRFKYIAPRSDSRSGYDDDIVDRIQGLKSRLKDPHSSEADIRITLRDIASLFSGEKSSTSISSFEVMQSGLVDELLDFTTEEGRKAHIDTRQRLLLEAFLPKPPSGPAKTQYPTPLAALVKRLQENLTRIESFEVVKVLQAEDSKRGSTSMLVKQLRLRLVADDPTSVPRNCTNITVSIHAIATFQALHDYLRPRVSGFGGPGSSRMSGVLAAFAAAAGLPPDALSRAGFSFPSPSSTPSHSTNPTPAQQNGTSGELTADVGRRRSLRLSKKEAASSKTPTLPTSGAAPKDESDSHPPPDFFDNVQDAEQYLRDELESEMYDEDANPGPITERTVNLSVAEDGQRVEAQTPDGTRVATPNPSGSTPSTSVPRASYASALKAKPTDWHLQFSMDDIVLPLDMTVYGAVHQQHLRKGRINPGSSNLWSEVYTIKFKKVEGPAPAEGSFELGNLDRGSSPVTTSVPDDAPHSKILRLLRVLHKLNTEAGEHLTSDRDISALPESAFINNKLTAKLTRQLEEPMIVASSCLPDWALDLPQHYPFLFPFTTRFSFLQSTSFGYARLILKWQNQQARSTENTRRDEAFGYLGRLQRQKVRISRKFLLESAIKVLELYGSSSSVLEVEYFDEVGTGLGPTLEFYSLVSKEFARRDIKLWHESGHSDNSAYVSNPTGLYPAPFSKTENTSETIREGSKKKNDLFSLLGQFIAKALLDSRIIDIHLNKIFLKLVMGENVPLTIASLKAVDPVLGNSLAKIQAYANIKREMEAGAMLNSSVRSSQTITIDGVKLEDLALDFTLPGYDIELKEGGRDIVMDASNVEEYVREVLDIMLGRGVKQQAEAFRTGFSKVFPITDLRSFTCDELSMLIGNTDEDWSTETLAETVKADHGFHSDSRAIHNLIETMSSFDATSRRQYLQFITGSPKLPIGGFRGLNPPLTVVRKPHEAPLAADDYLPSVMTCVNYLKLPDYSSQAVMKQKLEIAMKEGVGSFHLS
ncbi:Ubiquitin fusion degradation protein 4 [Tulasnella sp. 418]|nr:Ubiquitin fusion degradation protein 4 [Tulasnella sp. 418]